MAIRRRGSGGCPATANKANKGDETKE